MLLRDTCQNISISTRISSRQNIFDKIPGIHVYKTYKEFLLKVIQFRQSTKKKYFDRNFVKAKYF